MTYQTEHDSATLARNAGEDRLALYHFSSCPFCLRVRDAIEELGIDVELRDIRAESRFRDELSSAVGRTTVPVLRVTPPDGEEHWLPESNDIVDYLHLAYGNDDAG